MRPTRMTGKAPEVTLRGHDQFQVSMKSTINLSAIAQPRRDLLAGVEGDIRAIVLVGRATSYEEARFDTRYYGEFQVTDMRSQERFTAPKLVLETNPFTLKLIEEFDERGGPLFFGLSLYEQPGKHDWRWERIVL